MKLRPLSDRVIVRQNEAEEKTKSGIVPSALFAPFKAFWEQGVRADASDLVLVKSAALTT